MFAFCFGDWLRIFCSVFNLHGLQDIIIKYEEASVFTYVYLIFPPFFHLVCAVS